MYFPMRVIYHASVIALNRAFTPAISNTSFVKYRYFFLSIWMCLMIPNLERFLKKFIYFFSPDHRLTNEESRKNWEEHGNPDGPQGKINCTLIQYCMMSKIKIVATKVPAGRQSYNKNYFQPSNFEDSHS